jgi:hypothetical protein
MDMNNLSNKSVLHSLQIGAVSLSARAIGFIVVLPLLAACASGVMRTRGDAEVVKERSQARWDAMVKGDFKAGYRFLSPAGKAIYSEDQYEAGYKRGFWTGADVEKVECPTAELCEADVRISYKYGGAQMKTPLREKWVKQDSNWWFVLER